jgi:hypothetical protein
MLSGMYLWALLGYDIVAGPTAHGVCSDPASAMRMGEPRVKDGSAFLCVVEEVRQRISVGGLETTYQGTGRYFVGRRTRSGGIYWEAMSRTVDPSELYVRPLCHDGIHATSDLH